MAEQEINKLIAREDLVARLDRAAAGPVTIISAPAGSGKTSLLRDWSDRAGRARRVVFVPVRRGEQDAQVFWLALLKAVRHSPAVASDTEPPTATPDFDARTLADRVFAELADWRDPIIVVIDDLHEGEPARLTRPAGPRTQQRRLPAAGRRRDDRHLARRRAIQGNDEITPVDQPGSCWSRRHRPALISTPGPPDAGHAVLAPPVSVSGK